MLIMSGAIPLLHPYAFMAWRGYRIQLVLVSLYVGITKLELLFLSLFILLPQNMSEAVHRKVKNEWSYISTPLYAFMA
jgi:hypothetical protein